jgi:DNA-binding transcriptional LysR family regulator
MYQDVYFELGILPKPTIESSVREGSIDVGVTGDPAFFKSLSYHKFSDEVHHLYVAAESAVSHQLSEGARLRDVPYVKRRYRTGAFETLERRYGLRATATAGSLEAVAILVAAGVGVGILPSHYVSTLPHSTLRIVATPETPVTSPFYVLHRMDAPDAPVINNFVTLLMELGAMSSSAPQLAAELRHNRSLPKPVGAE